ncbi:MAG: hypothetical protein K6E91_02965 [Butyrivibrio sp.]|nr:hypothetical protein [Butyrivibrio sp.]
MAERPNKFKALYKNRKESNLTDELVDQLYNHEEEKGLSKPTVPVEPVIVTEIKPEIKPEAYSESISAKTKHKKVGRPKKTEEERSMFNFRISDSKKEMINVASSAKGLSKTDYIEYLIEEDYKKNKEYYDMVKANMKK